MQCRFRVHAVIATLAREAGDVVATAVVRGYFALQLRRRRSVGVGTCALAYGRKTGVTLRVPWRGVQGQVDCHCLLLDDDLRERCLSILRK